MSLTEYFEQHEEQAFVAKALATAVAINIFKNLFPGLVSLLFLMLPFVFLIGIRLHAAASGVDAMELLREHVTFLPVIRSESERSEVTPWITYGIIFANIVIFYFFEARASEAVLNNLVFLPHEPDPFNVPFSAISSMFLHGSNGHLWGNMTFLWVVGSAVERRVGRLRFSWLYLLTGVIGGLIFILIEFLFHGRAGHALGASGAIAGIMGVFAVRCYFKTMIFPVPILGIFSLILPISLKVRLNSLLIMALFFLSDLSGGIQQITGEGSMIGHWAHLGGMVSGMLIAGWLRLGEAAVEERHLEKGLQASEATVGFEGGERSLGIALERNPNNIDALLAMGRLKTKFHNSAAGREAYDKALALMLRERPADLPQVLGEYWGKYLAVPQQPETLTGLVPVLEKSGDVELLIRCLERLVELPEMALPAKEKFHFQLATLLEFTSCFEAARNSFARFAHHYPASVLAETAREKAGGVVYRPPVEAVERMPQLQLCPACGKEMAVRRATSGPAKGQPFRVCSGYPACRTVQPVDGPAAGAPRAAMAKPPAAVPQYRLVFDGTIGFTCDPAETKARLVKLFRCSEEQVERLCCGSPTVLKRGLDQAQAVQYKEAISATGALCSIAEEEGEPKAAPAPAAAAKQAAAPEPPAPEPAQAPTFACPKCGALQDKGEGCVACGVYFAKLAAMTARQFEGFREHLPGGKKHGGMSEQSERRWAMWCHLLSLSGLLIPFGNLLFPLLVWRWKRRESAFVDFHGRTVVNFQLTLLIFAVGMLVVGVMTRFAIGFMGPLMVFVGVYSLVMVVAGAIKSNRGDIIEIGLSAEFLK